MLGSLLS